MHADPSPDAAGPTDPSDVPDRAVPGTAPAEGPTVVGIGASAGGLAALKEFFSRVPEDSGLAFVVVVHLSPDHESHLADLLQPHVRMPIAQVRQTVALEPDHVYVIPPGCNLSAVDTHLRLSDLEERRRDRAPIDHFFRTVAKTHDGSSVAVVLTGTGSDGTLGLKEIKEKGGLTVVQDPNEAEYDGMPQSAIATGLVDLVLPLAEIPEALVRYARTEPRVVVPEDEEDVPADERQLLHKVFAHVRARTGRDFSRYKRSTILRRVTRRMQMAHIEELGAYLDLLRERPEEVRALADDLLINVTNFFRDPEVYEALEVEVVPALFEGKGPEDTVRVWSVGCATGEEAYSLAVLLLEEADRRAAAGGQPPRLQVFASDLHERSLDRARDGFYPGDIEADVSAERLRRFFQKEDGGYRVRKEVRELVVFAPHNLLSDPPFSKLDLVACRNVLIYLQRDVQREVAELFHYALRPDGHLVLGTSESLDAAELFRVEDKKRCVYRKRNVQGPDLRLPVFPVTRPLPMASRLAAAGRPGEPLAYGALHQQMVEEYAPPSLLVSPDDKVVHVSEHAGRYLSVPGGEPSTSVFKLVRDELRIDLRAAVHAAREAREPRRTGPVPVRLDGELRPVALDVRPATEPEQDGFVLVIFDERAPAVVPRRRAPAGDVAAAPEGDGRDGRERELEAEVALVRERLQAIIEEYETAQEETKAANEELQSANEELRSTMEELETSKEELQSMNEELQTVNQENRHKVEELAQLTGDLQNLLSATDIATLFLDRELRILRFTPKVTDLFNVRMADRGRPLSDLTHRLGYDELQDEARAVLRTLVPAEREVQDEAGRWYLTRLLPYRSPEDRIDGVVITLVEITERKRAEDAVRRSEERQAYLVRLNDALRPLADPAAIEREASRLLGEHLGADRAYYVEVDEAAGVARVNGDYLRGRSPSLAGEHRLEDYGWTLPLLRRDEAAVVADVGASPLVPEPDREAMAAVQIGAHVSAPLVKGGRLVGALCVTEPGPRAWTEAEVALVRETGERIWDAIERARAEADLRRSEGRFRALVAASAQIVWTTDPEGRVTEDSPSWRAFTGQTYEEWAGWGWLDAVHPDDREGAEADWRAAVEAGTPLASEFRVSHAPSGRYRWTTVRAVPLRDAGGAVTGWVGMNIDVDEQKAAEAALRASEARYRAMAETVPDVLFTTSAGGVVDYVSRQHGVLTGVPAAEVVGTEMWPDLIHPDDHARAEAAWADAVRHRRRFETRYRVRSAEGGYCWVIVRARPVFDEGGALARWHGTLTDINALTVAEEEVRQLNETLEARVEERTAAARRHEARARELARALTLAEQEERRRIAYVLHDDLQQVLAGAKIAVALEDTARVESVLDEAIRLTRTLALELSPPLLRGEDLTELLQWLVSQTHDLFGLDVDLDVRGAVSVPETDLRVLLYQLLRELLFNVVKHAGTMEARLTAEDVGGRVRVVVEDEGAGFDVAALGGPHASGLGLPSVRERLEVVGGRLELDSTPGAGTRVSIEVPSGAGAEGVRPPPG